MEENQRSGFSASKLSEKRATHKSVNVTAAASRPTQVFHPAGLSFSDTA